MPSYIVHVGQLGPRMTAVKWTSWPCKRLVNGVGTGPLDNQTIVNALGPRLMDSDLAGVTNASGPTGGPSVVEAILRFHYMIQSRGVFLQKVIISDGKTPGLEKGPFKTTIINLECNHSVSNGGDVLTPANVAPANQSGNLVKSPVGLGVSAGRQFIRWMFKNAHLGSGERDGTQILQDFVELYKGYVTQALTLSGMRNYFFRPGPYADAHFIGQGRYYSKAEYTANPVLKGVLKVTEAIEDIDLVDGKPRQVTRGKRKKVTPSQAAAALAAVGIPVDMALVAQREAVNVPVDTGIRPPLNVEDIKFLEEAAERLGVTPESLRGGDE